MSRHVLLVAMAAFFFWSATAWADGGRLVTRQSAGPWIVSLLVTPAEPGIGPADFSAMLEDRNSGRIVLDADLTLTLTPLDAAGPGIVVPLTRTAASNKLMQAASVVLPASGRWRATLDVSERGTTARIASVLPVASHASRRVLVWWLAVFPFAALGLLALAEYGRSRVRRNRSVETRTSAT